jgi:hypothetical protein
MDIANDTAIWIGFGTGAGILLSAIGLGYQAIRIAMLAGPSGD